MNCSFAFQEHAEAGKSGFLWELNAWLPCVADRLSATIISVEWIEDRHEVRLRFNNGAELVVSVEQVDRGRG
jgi:hypothetical protein